MTWRAQNRRRRKAIAAVTLAVWFALGSTVAAFGALPLAGSGTTTIGGGNGSQYQSWNYNTEYAYTSATAKTNMPTTECVDSSIDWNRTDGHYDARRTRVCKPGATYAGSVTEQSNFYGANVVGARIAGGCRYVQSGGAGDYVACQNQAGSVGSWGQAVAWNALSHAVYLKRQNGTTDFNDGGFPQLPNT